ncbi:MAG: hypothetical protein WCL00_05545 [Bacteroidota bacterium]
MSTSHRIYIFTLSLIVMVVFTIILIKGYAYYNTGIEQRFFSPDHVVLKPSGSWGHGFGIIGSFFMIIGVLLYFLRKRVRAMGRWGLLKHWLEFHIFLCTLGPILVLYHTSFKFGGLVAVSFWSMVAVFASGVIGRFIYIQIPRSIEGRELSLSEVRDMKTNIGAVLSESYSLDTESINVIVESTKKRVEVIHSNFITGFFKKLSEDRATLARVKKVLKKNSMKGSEYKKVISLVKHDISLNRRIDRLLLMQNLFKYWHVAHLPFALVMLIIMIIHVAVTIVFGYRWIF